VVGLAECARRRRACCVEGARGQVLPWGGGLPCPRALSGRASPLPPTLRSLPSRDPRDGRFFTRTESVKVGAQTPRFDAWSSRAEPRCIQEKKEKTLAAPCPAGRPRRRLVAARLRAPLAAMDRRTSRLLIHPARHAVCARWKNGRRRSAAANRAEAPPLGAAALSGAPPARELVSVVQQCPDGTIQRSSVQSALVSRMIWVGDDARGL
jgi:hypothetical protein